MALQGDSELVLESWNDFGRFCEIVDARADEIESVRLATALEVNGLCPYEHIEDGEPLRIDDDSFSVQDWKRDFERIWKQLTRLRRIEIWIEFEPPESFWRDLAHLGTVEHVYWDCLQSEIAPLSPAIAIPSLRHLEIAFWLYDPTNDDGASWPQSYLGASPDLETFAMLASGGWPIVVCGQKELFPKWASMKNVILGLGEPFNPDFESQAKYAPAYLDYRREQDDAALAEYRQKPEWQKAICAKLLNSTLARITGGGRCTLEHVRTLPQHDAIFGAVAQWLEDDALVKAVASEYNRRLQT